jgi:2-oxoglutarate ferredoxin oxidoreductase subunit alpha
VVEEFVQNHETIIVLEVNRDGQMYGILRKELPIDLVPRVHSVAFSDGIPPRARVYSDMILEKLKEVGA